MKKIFLILFLIISMPIVGMVDDSNAGQEKMDYLEYIAKKDEHEIWEKREKKSESLNARFSFIEKPLETVEEKLQYLMQKDSNFFFDGYEIVKIGSQYLVNNMVKFSGDPDLVDNMGNFSGDIVVREVFLSDLLEFDKCLRESLKISSRLPSSNLLIRKNFFEDSLHEAYLGRQAMLFDFSKYKNLNFKDDELGVRYELRRTQDLATGNFITTIQKNDEIPKPIDQMSHKDLCDFVDIKERVELNKGTVPKVAKSLLACLEQCVQFKVYAMRVKIPDFDYSIDNFVFRIKEAKKVFTSPKVYNSLRLSANKIVAILNDVEKNSNYFADDVKPVELSDRQLIELLDGCLAITDLKNKESKLVDYCEAIKNRNKEEKLAIEAIIKRYRIINYETANESLFQKEKTFSEFLRDEKSPQGFLTLVKKIHSPCMKASIAELSKRPNNLALIIEKFNNFIMASQDTGLSIEKE